MPAATLVLLTLIWTYVLLMGGGVWPRDWYPCLAAIAVLAVVYFAFTRRADFAPRLPAGRGWALAAVAGVAGLQLVPLPLGLIRVLSPARAKLTEALGAIGIPAGPVTLSVAPAASWEWAVTLLGLMLTYLLVRELVHRFEDRPWVAAAPLIAVATLEAVLGLSQAFLSADVSHSSTGTFANRNHFAGLLAMCLPVAVMGAVRLYAGSRAQSRRRKPLAPALAASGLLLCAGVMLVAVISSLSRMGFICALCGLAVMGALALARGRAGVRRWLPVAAALAMALTAFIVLPTDQLIERFGSLSTGEEMPADERAIIWGDTVRLIGAYPLFGCGLGAYESALLPYKTSAPLYTVDYAHNDYLQLLAEMGVLGFAPLLLLVGGIYARAWRGAMQLARGPQAYLALGVAGGMAAIALHSMADFNLYIPANAMAAVWLGALAELP